MPQIVRHRLSYGQKTALIIACVVVGLAIIVAAIVWYIMSERSRAEARYNAMLADVAQLSSKRQYVQARDIVQAYLPEAKGERLCRARLMIGGLSTSLKDYPSAKQAYQQAIETPNCNQLGAMQGLALAADQAKDTQAALDAYKKVIDLWPMDDPDRTAEVDAIKASIKRLGGQP